AFAFRPGSDQFWTWACEPLALDAGLSGVVSGSATARESGDAYDRRYFRLNPNESDPEFRFLGAAAAEAISSMGLDLEARAGAPTGVSGESVAASSSLSQAKLGLLNGSPR